MNIHLDWLSYQDFPCLMSSYYGTQKPYIIFYIVNKSYTSWFELPIHIPHNCDTHIFCSF